jgi:hypothetical protein
MPADLHADAPSWLTVDAAPERGDLHADVYLVCMSGIA